MFYFVNSSASNSFDASRGQLNLSAPTSGTYEDIAIFVDQNDTTNYTINISGGSGADVTGVVYAKNQAVQFTGNSSSDQAIYIIADIISVSGGSTINTFDPDGDPIFYTSYLIRGQLVE
jgi:uncharacterized membrane protein